MPSPLTEITEIVTGLGTLTPDVASGLAARPSELANVPDEVWERLVDSCRRGDHADLFAAAHGNGVLFLQALDGLRGRRPLLVEWRGPQRIPGDDIVPADLRIDHVYLVSCKYMSKVLVNAGPTRLFDRLLLSDERPGVHWFHEVAPDEFNAFYRAARASCGLDLPDAVEHLEAAQQQVLRRAFGDRRLPSDVVPWWEALCEAVALRSAQHWQTALSSPRLALRQLWRILRITNTTYFVLGSDRHARLTLRVLSAWDWQQSFELREFTVAPQVAGQPEVSWHAIVRERATGADRGFGGHVEVRWSHGRFVGAPEAKVYLDTPHVEVPGYELL